jgi:signal peptidase II
MSTAAGSIGSLTTLSSHRLRNWVLLAASVALILALDQVTKWLVRQNLAVGEAWAPIPALAKVFTITHVRNTGVAFGQFSGLGWLFMFVNLIVLVGIVIYYPRIPKGQWQLRLAAVLIAAGDLGNVIDRMRTMLLAAQDTGSVWNALPRAYVTDFFDFKIWPVFNISDLCVVSGVTLLALIMWRQEQAKVTNERSPVANDQ